MRGGFGDKTCHIKVKPGGGSEEQVTYCTEDLLIAIVELTAKKTTREPYQLKTLCNI